MGSRWSEAGYVGSAISSRIALSLLVCAFVALVACDGTPVPPELRSSGSGGQISPGLAALEPLELRVSGFIGGVTLEEAAATQRARQGSRAITPGGQVIAGANGRTLKDLAWSDLFSEGLSTALLPLSSNPMFEIRVAGEDEALIGPVAVGQSGQVDLNFDARQLRTGANLLVALEVSGVRSEIKLPVLQLDDGDRLGINLTRRENGSLIAEVFVDAFNNAAPDAAVKNPDGLSDDGIRIVVDNGVDVDADGEVDTLARLDSADGYSFFDRNLDGFFGDSARDGIPFVEAENPGVADRPIVLASPEDQLRRSLERSIAFLYDPDLLGSYTGDTSPLNPVDAVQSISVSATQTSLRSNGVNTSALQVRVVPVANAIPLGAELRHVITREGGDLQGEGSEAGFLITGTLTSSRLLTPADTQMRLLSNGVFVYQESLRAPALDSSTVNAATALRCRVEVASQTADGLVLPSDEDTIQLLPALAPVLAQVLVGGQVDLAGTTITGLESLSRRARLVWGDVFEIVGANFGDELENIVVAIGSSQVTELELIENDRRLRGVIPQGAQSGQISVQIGSAGGRSSERMIIAGAQLEPLQLLPALAATGLAVGADISIVMSRNLDPDSVSPTSIFLQEVGTTQSLGWAVTLSAGNVLTLSEGAGGTALTAGLDYELVMTSDVSAADEEPLLRFDADSVVRFPGPDTGLESRVLATFTALAPDVTSPTLLTSVPADAATQVAANSSVVLTFSEALDAASIAAALDDQRLVVVEAVSGESVTVGANINDTGDVVTLSPTAPLLGGASYEVRIPGATAGANLRDAAGNALDVGGAPSGYVTVGFSVAMTIADISPRSGPPGSRVRILGGLFGSVIDDVQLQVNGVTIDAIESVTDREVILTWPQGVTGGYFELTLNGQTATSPVPFTLTQNLESVTLGGEEGSSPIGLAQSVTGDRIFVSEQGTGSISVYDPVTLTRIDSDQDPANGTNSIAVGAVPSESVMSADGKRLISLDFGGRQEAGQVVAVIDVRSSLTPGDENYAVEALIEVGRRPTRIAVNPNGSRWYVTNFLDDTVSVISAEAPFQVVDTIATGLGPNGISINADGTLGMVCNYLDGTISVFDTASNSELGTIPVGLAPARVAFSMNPRFAVVSCHGDSTLHIIDLELRKNIGQLASPLSPAALTFSRDGQVLYVCSRTQDILQPYLVEYLEGGLVLTPVELPIATGHVPSNVLESQDQSRLFVANEGDGSVSMVYLRSPVPVVAGMRSDESDGSGNVSLANLGIGRNAKRVRNFGGGNTNDPNSLAALLGFDSSNADARYVYAGQLLAFPMSGTLPTNPAPSVSLRIPTGETTFEEVPVTFEAVSAQLTILRATIPASVVSGTFEVVGQFGGNPFQTQTAQDSVLASFSATVVPQLVEVVRTTPVAGAKGVAANSPSFVWEFNQPVASMNLTLERLSDVLVSGQRSVLSSVPLVAPAPVSGSFGQAWSSTSVSALTENSASNNWYRMTLVSATGVAQNSIPQSVVVEFQLTDSLGPTLLRSVFFDLDGNGTDAGDVMCLVFDEELASLSLPQDLSSAGFSLAFNDSSLLGTGARMIAPTPELTQLFSTVLQSGGQARARFIELGTNPNVLVPGTRTAITGITNGTTALVSDLSSNANAVTNGGAIDIEYLTENVTSPRIISIVLETQTNQNQNAEPGEVIALYCTTPLTAVDPFDATILAVVGNANLGTNPALALDPLDKRRLLLTIGSGGLVSFQPSTIDGITIPAGSAALRNYRDEPLAVLLAGEVTPSIGVVTGNPTIDLEQPQPVLFRDLDGNGVDQGDVIVVAFNRELQVSTIAASSVFSLPVAGDTFGTGALVRASADISLSVLQRSRRVEIVLGSQPKLTPWRAPVAPDTAMDGFNASRLSPGDPSGLNVLAAFAGNEVSDVFGNRIIPIASGAQDIATNDLQAPSIVSVRVNDAGNDGDLNGGDSLIVQFSEPVRRGGVVIADFSIVDESTLTTTALTGLTLVQGGPDTLYVNDTLLLPIGAGTQIPLHLELSLEHASTNPITDTSGNQLSSFPVPLSIPVGSPATIQDALYVDGDGNGVDIGDVLYLYMSKPVVLGQQNFDAATLFRLARAGDSFGAGALVSAPLITADAKSGFSLPGAVGATDRRLLQVSLGENANLTKISGSFVSSPVNYLDPQSRYAAANTSASGIAMVRPRTLAFTGAQLVAALDDADRSGLAGEFDAIAFDLSGNNSADLSVRLRLPSSARAFLSSLNHFEALQNAFNAAAQTQGLKVRAQVNLGIPQLVVFDNGSGRLSTGGKILASGDVASEQTGVLFDGINQALLGLDSSSVIGGRDVRAVPSTVAAVLQSAELDSTQSAIELIFSKPMELPAEVQAASIFQLLVDGDRFGDNAKAFLQPDRRRVSIRIGPAPRLTPFGDFSPSVLVAGSPSGIRSRIDLLTSQLSDYNGFLPAFTTGLDITTGTATPIPDLEVQLLSGMPQSIVADGAGRVVASYQLKTKDADRNVLVDNLSFSFTGATSSVAQVIVYDDADAIEGLSAGDNVLGAGAPVAGVLSISAPYGTQTLQNTSKRIIVALETLPSGSASLGSLTMSLTDVDVSVFGISSLSEGLPAPAGTSQLLASSTTPADLTSGNIELSFAQTMSGGRIGHSVLPLSNNREAQWTAFLPNNELATSISGAAGELTGVAFDLTGDSVADLTVTTAGTGAFTGQLDTPEERYQLSRAFNASAQSRSDSLSRARMDVVNGGIQLSIPRVSLSGATIGLVAPASILRAAQQVEGSSWGVDGMLIFGGQNPQFQWMNSVRVLAYDGRWTDVPVTVVPDAANGLPAPRSDSVSVEVAPGVMMMHGGRDGTNVFNDTWLLRRAYAYSTDRLRELRWERISTTGPALHSAAGVWIRSSVALSRRLVIVGGAANQDGSGASNLVHAYSQETGAWQVLGQSGGTLGARWGAASAWSPAQQRLLLVGGRSGAASNTLLTTAQSMSFEGSGAFVQNLTYSPNAGTFSAFRAASSFRDSTMNLRVFGGIDASDVVRNSVLTITWDTVQNTLTELRQHASSVPALSGAASVTVGGKTSLVFGRSTSGVTNRILEVGSGSVDSADSGLPALLYWQPNAAGTSGIDGGDQIVIRFNGRTNLGDIAAPLSTLNEVQLAALVEPEGDTWPVGTSAAISTGQALNDTLIVTLGGNGNFRRLNFASNAAAPTPLTVSGRVVSSVFALAGTPDHTRSFTWTGAASVDFFSPANWLVAGAVPANHPGATDSVLIPGSATRPCVIGADPLTGPGLAAIGGTTTVPAEAASIVIDAGQLHSNRSLLVAGNGLQPAVVALLRGSLSMGRGTDGILQIGSSGSGLADELALHGSNQLNVLKVDSANDLRLSGTLRVAASLQGGGRNVLARGVAANLVFNGNVDSDITLNTLEAGEVVVNMSGVSRVNAQVTNFSLDSITAHAGSWNGTSFGGPSTVNLRSRLTSSAGNRIELRSLVVSSTGVRVSSGLTGVPSLNEVSAPSSMFFRNGPDSTAWTANPIAEGWVASGVWTYSQIAPQHGGAVTPPATGSGSLSRTGNNVELGSFGKLSAMCFVKLAAIPGPTARVSLVLEDTGGVLLGRTDLSGDQLYAGAWIPLLLKCQIPAWYTSASQLRLSLHTESAGPGTLITAPTALRGLEITNGEFNGGQLAGGVHCESVSLLDSQSGLRSITTNFAPSLNRPLALSLNGRWTGDSFNGVIPANAFVSLTRGAWMRFMNTSQPIQGALHIEDAAYLTTFAPPHLQIALGAHVSVRNTLLVNTSFQTLSGGPVGLRMSNVEMQGVPAGANGAYITLFGGAADVYTPEQAAAISIRHPKFQLIGGATTSVSVPGGSGSPFTVQGVQTGPGLLNSINEIDPAGTLGVPTTTGNLRWNSTGTLQYAFATPDSRTVTAPATSVVLAQMQIRGIGVPTFQQIQWDIASSINDLDANGLTNIRLLADTGVNPGFQPAEDNRLVAGNVSITKDDPVLSFNGTFTIVSDLTIYLVADLGSAFGSGDSIDVALRGISSIDGAFRSELLQNLVPARQRMLSGGRVQAGRLVVGNQAAPIMTAIKRATPGQALASGARLVIEGRNLYGGTLSVVDPQNPGIVTTTNAIFSAGGTSIAEIELTGTPDLSGVFEVSYTPTGGSLATFVLNVNSSQAGGADGSGEFTNLLTLTAINPAFAEAGFPVPVTISGSGFAQAGTNTITFGGIAATNIVVVSDAQITCTAPAGLADTQVDVELSNLNGTVTLLDAFLYTQPTLNLEYDGSAVPMGYHYQVVEMDFGTPAHTAEVELVITSNAQTSFTISMLDQDAAAARNGTLNGHSSLATTSVSNGTTGTLTFTTPSYAGVRRFLIVFAEDAGQPAAFHAALKVVGVRQASGSLGVAAVSVYAEAESVLTLGGVAQSTRVFSNGTGQTVTTTLVADIPGSGTVPVHFELFESTGVSGAGVTLAHVGGSPSNLGTLNSSGGLSANLPAGGSVTLQVTYTALAGAQNVHWAIVLPGTSEFTSVTGNGADFQTGIAAIVPLGGQTLGEIVVDFGVTPRELIIEADIAVSAGGSGLLRIIDADAAHSQDAQLAGSPSVDTAQGSGNLVASYTSPSYSGLHRFLISFRNTGAGVATFSGGVVVVGLSIQEVMVKPLQTSQAGIQHVVWSEGMVSYRLDGANPNVERNFSTEIEVAINNGGQPVDFLVDIEDFTGLNGLVVRDVTSTAGPKNFLVKTNSTPRGLSFTLAQTTTARIRFQTAETNTLTAPSMRWTVVFPTSVTVTSVVGDGVPVDPESLPQITLPGIRQGAVGRPYIEVFTVQGGTPPYTFTMNSVLPNGLKFDPALGTLYGSCGPNSDGTYTLFMTVTDAAGKSSSASYALQVAATNGVPIFNLPDPDLGQVTVGTPFVIPFTMVGGESVHKFQAGIGNPIAGTVIDTQMQYRGTPAPGSEGYYFIEFEATSLATGQVGGVVVKIRVNPSGP